MGHSCSSKLHCYSSMECFMQIAACIKVIELHLVQAPHMETTMGSRCSGLLQLCISPVQTMMIPPGI